MKDRDFIKIQKKNLQIWSLYDQEEPITNYNYRLKRKKKVRAASFVRHVAQRTRVITPARGFDPWRSSQPTGCRHVVTRCHFIYIRWHVHFNTIIVLAQLVLLASSQLWGGEIDSCLVLFFKCMSLNGRENKTWK